MSEMLFNFLMILKPQKVFAIVVDVLLSSYLLEFENIFSNQSKQRAMIEQLKCDHII